MNFCAVSEKSSVRDCPFISVGLRGVDENKGLLVRRGVESVAHGGGWSSSYGLLPPRLLTLVVRIGRTHVLRRHSHLTNDLSLLVVLCGWQTSPARQGARLHLLSLARDGRGAATSSSAAWKSVSSAMGIPRRDNVKERVSYLPVEGFETVQVSTLVSMSGNSRAELRWASCSENLVRVDMEASTVQADVAEAF